MEKLGQYFEGVAWKYLTAVDADPGKSNQHEFGGLVKAGFRHFLGDPGEETYKFPCRFMLLSEDKDKSASVDGVVSWYDSRRGKSGRGPELRLYYVSNEVTDLISEGMFFLIAKTTSGELILVFCDKGSSEEAQLRWLFGLDSTTHAFSGKAIDENQIKASWSARWVLDELGIELFEDDSRYLDLMLTRFGGAFPKTREFSALALELSPEIQPVNLPDTALVSLMDREESLFRQLERHFVEEKLKSGFSDVEQFISYSLSIQNRRKSRVGYALENHLEFLFKENGVEHIRGAETENRSKPDFLFPGLPQYENHDFPDNGLTILGAKSTCKDRWRQVLSEAGRIKRKHLVTLEPGISGNQLDEMEANDLQLVVPSSIHETYKSEKREWLWNLSDFIEHVRDKQGKYLGE
ncbi:type II restriction endonuclease [Alcanivorax nanhaiticus]|uniref:Type II restriction endonuclease n=1 Tax=Alcanivorax nanhaiticus TaxID=1177154 RepID=A0A095SKP6_9GAMM|nr:type II restriction endonuclease [Alcanivorax nanhaiticus]KGD65117.1 type II restriction endonuclease [Alcanivorax nanhaiticus]